MVFLYVRAFLSSFSISSTDITVASYVTTFISINPCHPLVALSTPFSLSRTDFPTSYHETPKIAVDSTLSAKTGETGMRMATIKMTINVSSLNRFSRLIII